MTATSTFYFNSEIRVLISCSIGFVDEKELTFLGGVKVPSMSKMQRVEECFCSSGFIIIKMERLLTIDRAVSHHRVKANPVPSPPSTLTFAY